LLTDQQRITSRTSHRRRLLTLVCVSHLDSTKRASDRIITNERRNLLSPAELEQASKLSCSARRTSRQDIITSVSVVEWQTDALQRPNGKLFSLCRLGCPIHRRGCAQANTLVAELSRNTRQLRTSLIDIVLMLRVSSLRNKSAALERRVRAWPSFTRTLAGLIFVRR
jgi:hypothetical protein